MHPIPAQNHGTPPPARPKAYYTTTEVAELCHVHRNTILGAILRGNLRVRRTPGGHARIAKWDVEEFCKRRLLEGPSSPANRVLLCGETPELAEIALRLAQAGCTAKTVKTGFDIGFETANFRPDIMLFDLSIVGAWIASICARIRKTPAMRDGVIIGYSSSREKYANYRELGLDVFYPQPLDVTAICGFIVQTLATAGESAIDGPGLTGS